MAASSISRLIDDLTADIRSGKLPPGSPLPTHRQLARKNGIAIASASKVYTHLKAIGLVVGETGRGTFVRDRPQQREWDAGDEARQNTHAADLSFNHPTWPAQGDMLRKMLRELSLSGDLAALLHQQPPGGRAHERRIVADFLAQSRGIQTEADGLFLVNGAQQGLDITTRALLSPGDTVAVDALTYPGFKMVAQTQHLALQPVRSLPDGPDLDALDALCQRKPVRAIYVMPTMHNPLGWVLTTGQRRHLAEIARHYDCLIIEDASYAYLAKSSPPALVTLAPERTIYIASLSKSLASGLRFGFIVAPERYRLPIKATIRASYWSLPSLITAIGTRWIADGTVARQERRMRQEASKRQAIARQALCGMDIIAHPSSLFLWLRLPSELRMDRIATALAEHNIAVSKATAYSTTRHAPHALRLGLSSVPLEDLRSVLVQVRSIIERFPI
ncbi:PLP-dependent aminotransferase family protein [Pandoraea apista]|uniref:aminotransferase-like domain-containing protein n=1 Tax=Pandoraea apista TaxID=93218 RepID=UPI0006590413|nr:PLP-dependent aminotransferase family protein [Pandoraea apista]ALS64177.1 GntR family transcriptional regulator [Pandoraea apista]RRW94436.1 PLP-dependent aminotransferase family protein [Pandoraea apista]RRX01411.1 PLP-dependent aminotransferase family protein [Pandoraea apista]CFB63796.1 putative HTH-type transcriptional regulator YjiR [Pandoraea apista]